MQDQRRRVDARAAVAHVGRVSTFTMTARAMLGDAARLPARSHHARNASSPATLGAIELEHVEALLDGIGIDRDRRERIGRARVSAPTG